MASLTRIPRPRATAPDAGPPAVPMELPRLELSGPILAQAGMELGAHTLTHPFLSLLSESEQLAEIAGSVERIRAVTGAEVVGLAYPNGDHDAVTVRAAQAAGLPVGKG